MSRPLHLLVVDDDPLDRLLVELAVQTLPVRLSTAADGQAALDQLRQAGSERPDVLLLDIHMPGLDGFEVLAQLKAQAAWRELPVIMFSTSEQDMDVQRAYAARASSYLVKGSDPEHLAAQLAALLRFLEQTRLTRWPERAGAAGAAH